MSAFLRWPAWRAPARPDPAVAAIAEARLLLAQAAASGRAVPDSVSQPLLAAAAASSAGPLPEAAEQRFYAAYTELSALTRDLGKHAKARREYPFERAIEDAELLLKHAAETGIPVSEPVAAGVLAARTALKAGALPDTTRVAFYARYAELSKLFGTVTAETIRHCASNGTKRRLRRDRGWALLLTALVATVSVLTFVADTNLRKTVAEMATGNDLAARLRVGLTANGTPGLDLGIFATDPCRPGERPPGHPAPAPPSLADVNALQDFAATIRSVQSRSIKLNGIVKRITAGLYQECSAFAETCRADRDPAARARIDAASRRLQINAAIADYPAEVLCRITTFQDVRSFATNVADNYSSIVGAVTSYALPILYALLGAYAFRLRQFAETILKRTYHPSFSDSARMITAVIAGAICGLFNPAQGLALSPLAVAFLVGYGVELFFRLLDTLIGSFSAPAAQAASRR